MLLMSKKHNFNILKSISVSTLFVFGTSLNADTLIQTQFDKRYTTTDRSKNLFTKQIFGLNDTQEDQFVLGKSFFNTPWVEAPSATTARDGLGPLFNSNTCLNCHPKNGRGSIYNKHEKISRNYVTRLSIPPNGSKAHQEMLTYAGFVKEPVYGGQISVNAVPGVSYEAKPVIHYKDIIVTYPDGEKVTLKQPLHGIKNQVKALQYTEMHKEVIITNRLAPALVGLGFLEQLTDAQILENQDIDDKDGDGISGKANRVYDRESKGLKVGRYTYKASAPSVLQQSAAAAHHDMSLSNPLFPQENCTKVQKACLAAPKADDTRSGSQYDLPMDRLRAISFYLQNLKIPKSIVREKEGEELFSSLTCIKCHKPSFTLKSGYTIKPFTDMLLHDMGEALSDGRSEFLATSQEWRTAALWSIGRYKNVLGKKPELLHDGRAKNIEEAILWHGGEAKNSKISFMHLSKEEREKVIKYIKEL